MRRLSGSRIHRRCIRSHGAIPGSRSTQVESIFALLVESGALYCALWVRSVPMFIARIQ